ncbi:MAG: hypothetical protein HFJ38_04400 [Bacilli bacterium]|nr:hypothetical protein [Bacilli bacterium]
MQANNKSDAAQVYEGAGRATKIGIKDSFKFILKPLTLFSYHYFLEGIKAVQKDGTTKELEKITNLSYAETVKVMQKCQNDGIRVVASERKLKSKDSEFGKNKSMYQQRQITKYSRKIKKLSDIKAKYPKVAKILKIYHFLDIYEKKHDEQIKQHKNKRYNIYYNKSRNTYMTERIKDIIEYRTGLSKKYFEKNEDIQNGIKNMGEKDKIILNSEELKNLSEKFKLHEMGNVEIADFKKDYCIHEIPFATFVSIKDDLEIADIPYGVKIITNDKNEQIANIYFENKHLERYSELGFTDIGKIRVFGNDKNLQWDINSQDDLITFKTKTGEQEKQTYSSLSGKSYLMKREENECVWTVFKADLKGLAEKEKKRKVVDEELKELHIFEDLQKESSNSPTITENHKEIEVSFDNEKEGDVNKIEKIIF